MPKTKWELDLDIKEALGSRSGAARGTEGAQVLRRRSLFPSARELASEYLSDFGFVKLNSAVTKKTREPFEIYGTSNGSCSICLADSLKEIGTAHLAEK